VASAARGLDPDDCGATCTAAQARFQPEGETRTPRTADETRTPRTVDACAADDVRFEPGSGGYANVGRRSDANVGRGSAVWRQPCAASGSGSGFGAEALEGAVAMARPTAAALAAVAFLLMFTATASASAPTISYSITGISGANGWYRGSSNGNSVVLHWSVSLDATATNCSPAITIPGPTTGTKLTCAAQNLDGSTTAVTHLIKIDATAPTGITAIASRPPDHKGWYNHPVVIRWSGTDATSGIATCASLTYHGPDSGAATVDGGCTDRAGNTALAPVRLAYDSTPPVLHNVTERSTRVSDALSWSSSNSSDRFVVRRAVRGSKRQARVFIGSAGTFTDKKIRPGVQYLYSVQAIDEAGNPSNVVRIAGLPEVVTLTKTTYVPLAAPNPILRWGPVRGARYYNVQLFRGSKRIWSVWPKMHEVGVPATWTWSGHRFRLAPGQYRWYVWAGFGSRKLAHYRIKGSARFVVPRT
jgi:hypothetical protein